MGDCCLERARMLASYWASSSLRVCFTCETNRRLLVRFRWPSRHVLMECRLHLRGRIPFLGHRPLSHAIYLRHKLRNGALDRNLFRRGICCVLTIAIQVDKLPSIRSCHLFWWCLPLNSEETESHQVSENSFFVEPTFFTDSSSGCSRYLCKCDCSITVTSALIIQTFLAGLGKSMDMCAWKNLWLVG
jgi:hypothetical protein